MTCLSIVRLLPVGARVVGGSIAFKGRDVMTATSEEIQAIRGQDIGMILQDPMTALNPLFTLGNQIREGLKKHLRLNTREAHTSSIQLLERVGIPDAPSRARVYPHQLSGGMRQRVVGAIGISCEPQLLIADEPTTALDVTIQAQYLRLLRTVRSELGSAMIFVTHDLSLVARMCERVAVMYAGRVVEEGPTSQVFRNPRHPYTLGLLRSNPSLAMSREAPLPTIPGIPPDPTDVADGCAFSPRCPVADAQCDETPPELELLSGQRVECWHPRVASTSQYNGSVGDPE